jgi:2OG-Fe(II) oxygenase superfamily
MTMVLSIERAYTPQSVLATSPVKVATSLCQQDLLDLVEGKYIALRIRNYYPKWLCEELCTRLLELPEFARYLRAQNVGVQRTGITFFETKGDRDLLNHYYAQAQRMCATIRNACFPYLSPIDKLRLELEEVWNAGARLENIHEQTMMVGIVRMFEDCFELPPHQDVLVRDIADSPSTALLLSQLSANVYLREAGLGGELEVWGIKPSYAEFLNLSCDDLHFDRNKLPDSKVLYKPCAGDLVLFDSGRVHAVRPAMQGPRVSMSCFVGYRGRNLPLTYWS